MVGIWIQEIEISDPTSIMNPNDARAARQELAYMNHRGIRQMRWMVQTLVYSGHNWSQRLWIHELIHTGE